MTRRMLALLLVGSAGCGPPTESGGNYQPPVDFTQYGAYDLWPCVPNNPPQPTACGGLVRKYVAAIAETPACDPHLGSCIRRPLGGNGPGDAMLCNCTTAVYPGSTQAADSVLSDFYAAGCAVMCCACPAPPPAAYGSPSF